MTRYEVLFLTIPEITADESAAIESQCEKVLKDASATLISYERWGKYLLAYPIKNYDYGVYFLVRFEVADAHKDALLQALRAFFAVKYSELVMRHVVTALDANASLSYQRAESLEEAPSREESYARGAGRNGREAYGERQAVPVETQEFVEEEAS